MQKSNYLSADCPLEQISQKQAQSAEKNLTNTQTTNAAGRLRGLLTDSCIEALRQGVALLGELEDWHYVGGETTARKGGGTLGGHFRHCLEFVNCFLAGAQTGKINYNNRRRDHQIEIDREYAINEFLRQIEALENFQTLEVKKSLLVKPEDLIETDGEDFWCASSLERELEFLQSHTIHHYALIAFKLRAMDFPVPAEFGVAASTLKFWKQNAN